MTRERVTWQLETLREKGVMSVCPIQRSPGRCDPESFSPKWWEMFEFVHKECRRLGMTLWAYDQLGYGHYGWLEKAAAKAGDTRTSRIEFIRRELKGGATLRLQLPEGELVGARAYPVTGGIADDAKSVDLAGSLQGRTLEWQAPAGDWRVAVSVAKPYLAFQLSPDATETFLDMLYGELERRLGKEAMGTSFAGVFQDEHPPTPRDIHTKLLAAQFRERFGYEIGRAIPALHFDVGPLTPKYRTDFFDAYLALDEESYWKRVFDWTNDRGVLTSYDNWGRNNIYRQSEGYIDYFRTQRWFSAPGYDDSQPRPVRERNYYDTRIASSIARLYYRPRVWSEAFHSAGWGRTTDQTLSWLSANYAWGANIYDEHGLYYSTRASTWEHAAPDPHWRQPYWVWYGRLSDWVTRLSYMMTRGFHVVDAGVHYPVASLLAGDPPGVKGPDYNHYMKLSRALNDAAIDNDIIDDDSILAGTLRVGDMIMGGNGYRALVFGPEVTIRKEVLKKVIAMWRRGGTVIFYGRLPEASTENGRNDGELEFLLNELFSVSKTPDKVVTKEHPDSGGFAAFLPEGTALGEIPKLVTEHIDRTFIPQGGEVYVSHRQLDEVDIFLIQNVEEKPVDLIARVQVDAIPEVWDLFTGEVRPVDRFERHGTHTTFEQRLEGNCANLVVFRPGEELKGGSGGSRGPAKGKKLSEHWDFSVIPTRDNKWGEMRWPPSDEAIGPEIRSFRYAEERGRSGVDLGWNKPGFDDKSWTPARYSIGPYWLALQSAPAGDEVDGRRVEFSKSIGTAAPTPWGGHAGYPDGSINRDFFHVPEGRPYLFTRIRSPKKQRLGLRVELRQSKTRLWVNGKEQRFEDAVGDLPLEEGVNSVLLELADGKYGRLFVQKEPPAPAMVKPDLREGSWVWAGDTTACYVRRSFELPGVPAQARVVVTADNGYRLFVNGVKIEEEIGPWAKWETPESFDITRHLRKGPNVVAAWCQDLGGDKGFVLAMKARSSDGRSFVLYTDETWKGSVREQERWEKAEFDDTDWETVRVLGLMGIKPWGMAAVERVGAASEPRRKLAIHLPNPYLTCFEEVPDVEYDILPPNAKRVGWYRMQAPPGLKELDLGTDAKAEAWVDGVRAEVRDGVVRPARVPRGVSTVAVRLDMKPGAYAGAAFPLPPKPTLGGGKIGTGEWANYALPTYSGIGVYAQDVSFTAEELNTRAILDLGEVLVSAEVLVNGESAGVRLARPFKFDLTGRLRAGANRIEVRVANTIAPHYTVTNQVANLGPTASGLIGPVTLDLQQ